MRQLRGGIIGFVLGAILLGLTGAGVGSVGSQADKPISLEQLAGHARGGSATAVPDGTQLPGGKFLVGAAKVSIAPDPERWVPDVPEGRCSADIEGCLITFDGRYAKSVREPYGVWARALSISNGDDTIILAVMDAVGWFRYYPAEICADCGTEAIRSALSAELGVPSTNMVISSTHTHASGNTISEIPRWYYEQVRDAVTQAMREAYATMRLATIDVGVTTSRWNNEDRRIVTRAVPDYEVQWLKATEVRGEPIGVLYNYAAHPTVLASNDTLHAGYPGAANHKLEQDLGADVAMFIAGGLGNQKVVRSRGIDGLGFRLADVIERDMIESPRRLKRNDIASDVREMVVPGDNAVLLGARAANIFVRDILPPAGGGPGAGRWGKNATTPSCVGAGFVTVNTLIGGFRLGEAAIMTAPGEIFSTISLVTKDYLENAEVVFVLALANDQLGYIIPYEEFDEVAQKGPGLGANSTDIGQYEEVLSLGRCVGEQVMDELIASGRTLGFIG